MREADIIIVGAGPAGSSAAWALARAGRECLILERESFPRLKLCGGWITPQVLSDLAIDPTVYPHAWHTFRRMFVNLGPVRVPIPVMQHSIRRIEFDHWLLERSGAPVITHTVKRIEEVDGGYLIDDQFRCRVLIGAGGTRCPVFRCLFRAHEPRPAHLQVSALECEFPHPGATPDCHLWFFRHGLPGYSWFVPKGNGYVNIGLGAMSAQLSGGASLHEHWQRLCADLARQEVLGAEVPAPSGYSYFLRTPARMVQRGNAYLVGDALGLATWDLAEGIGPAVRSGLAAARAILDAVPYRVSAIGAYTIPHLGRALKYAFVDRSRRAANGVAVHAA